MLRLTLRNLMARKVRLLMSTLAIVLGVGFLAGVMTFSGGLGATFDGIIKGSTSDAVVRPQGELSFSATGAGSVNSVAPADVERLRELPEVADAQGSVDGFGAFLLDADGKLVGGQAPTLTFNYAPGDNMLGEPVLELEDGDWPKAGQVVLDTAAAENGGYEVGDTVTLIVPFGTPTRTFELAGTANFNGGGTAGAILVLLDTPTAQEIFLEGQDVFTSVSLTAAEGVTQRELADAAEAVAPEGFTAVTGDKVVKESQDQIGQFLDVISIFLTVFAVIAIVVGGFIIFNTFTILVSQRVKESALLRALGASRRQVTASVLVEGLVMALVGATVGIGLGLALARALAALFRSFGLDISGDALNLSVGTVVTAYVVGLTVTMLAAYLPARRAARVPPVAAMRDDLVVQEKSLRWRTLAGTVALLVAVGLAVAGLVGAPGNDAVWIGVGALIGVITCAVMAPIIGHPLLVLCRAVFGKLFGTAGRLAGENALRNPRRTGATASALMIGLAVVSAVGVLAASMSKTSDALVDDQFSSDFLVQSPSFQSFPPSIGDAMADVDGVEVVSRMQGTPVVVDGDQSWLMGVDDKFDNIFELTMLEGSAEFADSTVLLSESEAEKRDVGAGDQLELTFPGDQVLDLTVGGVFEDTPVLASLNVPLATLGEVGLKRADQSLSVNVAAGADVDEVHDALDEIVDELPIVAVQDKEEFAEGIKAQVNQLLYMIYGLLALAIVIAVFGIVNTLGLSVLERTREIGLLRALGLSRGRLRLMVTLESVAIALLGAVLGLAVGLVVGVMLRHSLRDDLTELALPVGSLVTFLVVAVVFGVLAAVVPAIRASRLKVLDAIAME